MWTAIKNRISHLVSKLTSKVTASIHKSKGSPGKSSTNKNEVKEAVPFEGSRMTHNRLQSLDGSGYRQCYMDKIRQVASDSEPPEANREYWFGRDEDSSKNIPNISGSPAGSNSGTISSTKLPATSDTKTGKASDYEQDSSQSGSRIPSIIKAIPSRARITSTQLNAYVDSLPKPEE